MLLSISTTHTLSAAGHFKQVYMGLDNYQLRLIMYNKYEFCDHRQATATCMHITHRHLTATTARHSTADSAYLVIQWRGNEIFLHLPLNWREIILTWSLVLSLVFSITSNSQGMTDFGARAVIGISSNPPL